MTQKKKLSKAQRAQRDEARQIFAEAIQAADRMVTVLPPQTPPSAIINAAVVILSNLLRQLPVDTRKMLRETICHQLEEYPDIMNGLDSETEADEPDDIPIYAGSIDTDRDLPN